MRPAENRRKISNLGINPQAQLRFGVPFITLLLVSFAVINTTFFQIYQLRGAAAGDLTYSAFLGPLTNVMNQIVFVSSLGMVLIGILSVVFWITYSHRLFGPVVALRRQITALKEGRYEARCKLRAKDELKELAEELNALAEILQKRTQA